MTKRKHIPYGRQDINNDDIDSVIRVLKSDFLTQGPLVPLFECGVADYCDVTYATAVNSATSALHIACLSLNVGPGDYVWTSPNTFVASSNCALYCGASVDFVDIDSKTYNMDPICLERKLEEASKKNLLPKVVIPVHQSGQSCEMELIHSLGKKYGFKIIEDASHAIGGSYKDLKVGSNSYSDISVFSFHPVKMITSGEGGMALTNDPVLDKKLKLFRSHGITSNKDDMESRDSDQLWNYQQLVLGFNYRMTDIQAALGLNQLKRIDDFVGKRREIANKYNYLLKNLPVITPFQIDDAKSSYHLYLLKLDLNKIKKTHLQIYNELRENGILVNLHYIPVYLQPYYKNLGFKEGYCPESESYFKSILSMPIYTSLSDDDVTYVVETLTNIIE